MAKQLHTQVDIDADAVRIWEVLTDFAAYAQWNPFIISAEGTAVVGQRLTLRMQPKGGRAMTVRPTVSQADPSRRLSWLGRLPAPGVSDAEHSFTLQPLGADRTRLVQEEHFRGILVPLLSGFLDRGALPAFHAMNTALKYRAEQLSPPSPQ